MYTFKGIVRSLGAVAIVMLLVAIAPSPASAQLAAGCSCPAGFVPIGPNSCEGGFPIVFVAPTCPAGVGVGAAGGVRLNLNQSFNHVAASSQQLSFWGVEQILQGRRDQLQGTIGAQRVTSPVSGYADSPLDGPSNATGYADQSRSSNPLASSAYASYTKATPMASPAPGGPSFAAWTQGLGDWERDEPMSSTDTAHFSSTYANQTGIDATWKGLTAGDDALVVGIVGSWTGTHVTYDGQPTKTRLEGPGVGVYVTYVKGNFSVDNTFKFDFLRMTTDPGAGAPPVLPVNLTNAGSSGNIQYKVDVAPNIFIEPTAGYSYTRAMYGAGAEANGLADGNTLRVQGGARAGVAFAMDTVSAELSLKGLVYSNVISDGSPTTTDPTSPNAPTDQGKIRGEFDPALNLDFGQGYSVAFSGSYRFGDGMTGGSANVNFRKQW